MKKTLLATAIAAVAFSGSVMAQTSGTAPSADSRADELAARIDSMPEVYGNIQFAVVHQNVEDGSSSIGHYDNGSTIGVKHSHQITSGLEGFFKAELEFNADDKADNDGLNAFDEAYIGVRGDQFGQLWVGSDDSTYERAIDEIANYFEYAAMNIGGSYETGEGDLIQYMTPSFSGLKLHAAVQFNGDGDARTGGEKSYPYQIAATYEIDALELAVAMDSNDGNTTYSKSVPSNSNENTYGLRASYDLDDLRITGQYQTRGDFYDSYGVFAAYSMGPNVFAAAVEQISYDEADEVDGTVLTVQALHNLSSNMYLYVEGYYGTGDDDFAGTGSDGAQDVAVGGVYYF
ncbi:porin [Hydrocarboniclastica marina]|uniref:Porin n=1 Tax=Hydrocarboniclastica marina TaxID=2259620 RepID=A0A4P7XGV6_9ALTE|nr:porin [Hydrocarboniclastica marina]QCF25007.1 porin [Hydrocarboniclastica marina]